ncbi:MAG TPA: CPBP family intramembrane glutamic endopeptidase [Allosphingosinicella sp.]
MAERAGHAAGGAVKAALALVAGTAAAAAIVRFLPSAALGPVVGAGERLGGGDATFEALMTLALFGALLLAAFAGAVAARVNPLRPGPRPLRCAAFGALAGLSGLLAAVAGCRLAGTLLPGSGGAAGGPALLWGAALILFQATVEEIYFRGWLQPVLAARWGAAAGVLAASISFALVHFVGGGAENGVAIVNMLLGGLLFGLLALRTGGIAAPAAAHFAWNAAEDIGLGLVPNPGVGAFGSAFDLDLAGAALWGGSPEGLNASLAMTFALLALLAPLLIARGRTVSAAPPGSGRSDRARS